MPPSVRRLRKLEQSAFEKNLEDAYRIITETEILRLKIKINDFFSAMFGLLCGWLMVAEQFILERDIMEYSLGVARIIPGKTSPMSNILRVVVMLMSGGMVFTIIKHYQFIYRLKQIENHGIYYISIWHDPTLRRMFVFELIIASICLPPFVNFMTVADFVHGRDYYSASLIFTALSLLKSYALFRIYLNGSRWTDAEAQKIAQQYGTEIDIEFAFKCDIRSNNLKVYLLVAIMIVIYLGTWIFFFERYY